MRRALLACAAILAASMGAAAHPLEPTPFTQDPLGPLMDVTDHWQEYQPATDFCVRPDVYQFPASGTGPTVTGADPVCAATGWTAADTGLVRIHVETPTLCGGCRRVFFDYSQIPAENVPSNYFAHGHAYFHLASFNPSYTVEPINHSPNIKNFYNDKLVVPEGSPQDPIVWGFDTHAIAYTGNTANTVHSAVQGPYYTGPWYWWQPDPNLPGKRIYGAYLDVNVMTGFAPPVDHRLNEIGYFAGFHSGEPTCPDEAVGEPYADGDAFYGGCVDRFGGGSAVVDPYA